MLDSIKNFFNRKPTVEERLGAFEVSQRVIKIIDKIPHHLKETERRSYVVKIASGKGAYVDLIERIIHEQIRFRVRNIGREELTDQILGALGMADTILGEIEMLSAEHEQNIEDAKKPAPEHKDNPLSSGGSINILT